MIERDLKPVLQRLVGEYPAVAVTGPRQSGKTTLVRHALPDFRYVSLEDPSERAFAENDPRRFLEAWPAGTIIDEAQRVPALFSYLQVEMDEAGAVGQYVLTGSSNFLLMEGISQSLAGRVALLTLLPFSESELAAGIGADRGLEETLYAGHFPPIHDRGLEPDRWLASYVDTYLEKDVRSLIRVNDLSRFQLFVRLCAARSGQLLNLSSLGNDCGITHNTARSWLSVLEASYLVRLLRPHHANFGKRLVKRPKLYFLDTGLLCYLLEIDSPEVLLTHASRGAIFESWVFAELLKQSLHHGKAPRLHFWRDLRGREIDFVLGPNHALVPIEVKSGLTIASDYFKGLAQWSKLTGNPADRGYVVYAGDKSSARSQGHVVGWRDLPTIFSNNVLA